MTTLTGAGTLIRLALRRDRLMLAVWLYAFAAFVGATVYGFRGLYPTAAARAEFARTANGNPALLSLYGPLYGSSLGSFTAWRDVTVCALLAGLMSVFLVVRHTRAEEEAGRLELVGAAVVGRHAPLAAVASVAAGANAAVAAVMAAVAAALGLPAAGSVALAAGVAACGLATASVAAVTAQLARSARTARGLAIGVLGAAFLLRAVGDSVSRTGPRWLTWLSPVGWAELIRSFDGTRWWTLALPLALAAAAAAAAALLARRRDYGAGVLAGRPGRAAAGRALASPLGLAWRLQRASLLSWAGGALVYGVVIGSASRGIGGLYGSAQVRRAMAELGGRAGLVDAFLAAMVLFAGLAVAGFAISAVLRLRSEEAGQRADAVLATAVSRTGWALSHLVIAAAGAAAILLAAGLGLGVGAGAQSGGLGHQIARMTGAGIAELPAVLVMAGIAVALLGLRPRIGAIVSWSALGLVVALAFVGAILRLSHWVLDASPFTHLPKLPGGTVSATPLAALSAVAAALGAAGLAGLRRRDIG